MVPDPSKNMACTFGVHCFGNRSLFALDTHLLFTQEVTRISNDLLGDLTSDVNTTRSTSPVFTENWRRAGILRDDRTGILRDDRGCCGRSAKIYKAVQDLDIELIHALSPSTVQLKSK